MRHEILRNKWSINILNNTIHWSISSGLNGISDLFPGGIFLELDGEINNRDISGWNSESHSCQFSLELWKNKSDSLSSSS